VSISDYLELKLLDAVFNSTSFVVTGDPWVSLHTADPGETGTSECTGGSYVRKQVPFNPAASGALDNAAAIVWASMPACTVAGAGIWDAETTGNFLWGGLVTPNKTLNAGDTFQINAGDLDVALD